MCGECIHANKYVPYWTYPYSNPKCSVTGKSVGFDDVCCEFFDDGKLKSHKCKICGLNISDLREEEEYCEYCRRGM